MRRLANTLRRVANTLGLALLAALGLAAVVPLFSVIYDVYSRAIPAIASLGGLLTFLTATPPGPTDQTGGIGPALVGSLAMVALGAALGFAIGFPAGIYIGAYRHEPFARLSQTVVNVLVEFPTITVGLYVAAAFSLTLDDLKGLLSALPPNPLLGPLQPYNAYAGAIALALVMVPYVALYTAAAYASLERPVREAAHAVAGSERKAVTVVMRKAASKAILTAALLGTAKIAGETAPLLFTAFGNDFYGPLTGPTAAIPLYIYRAHESAFQAIVNSAYGAAAVLLTAVLAIYAAARYLAR